MAPTQACSIGEGKQGRTRERCVRVRFGATRQASYEIAKATIADEYTGQTPWSWDTDIPSRGFDPATRPRVRQPWPVLSIKNGITA
ncbi:hypothetical protein PybrP1_008813 [[Pythium] brassicae (nom. inval.)]|nr:hypothetical protein PybrP1_008813 [[Pythium] brassicae (nom. inval.)]